jgi:hypothetical protein
VRCAFQRIVSSAFCIHHAQLLIGGAATLLPASLFLILESLRELWLHDFRQSVAPPFWRFAFISGVLATIGSWVTLLAAYTALVSMGVKGSYNLWVPCVLFGCLQRHTCSCAHTALAPWLLPHTSPHDCTLQVV